MASTKAKNKQAEENFELPEMKDIPGQEHIQNTGVPGDTTISSDDEEGVRDGRDLLGEDEDVEIVMGTEADVTREDLVLLGEKDQDMDGGEDELVAKAELDDIDDDGDKLNESGSDQSGRDLDTPEGDEDDEDEENDYFSLGGDDKDDVDNGTPNEYRK